MIKSGRRSSRLRSASASSSTRFEWHCLHHRSITNYRPQEYVRFPKFAHLTNGRDPPRTRSRLVFDPQAGKEKEAADEEEGGEKEEEEKEEEDDGDEIVDVDLDGSEQSAEDVEEVPEVNVLRDSYRWGNLQHHPQAH